ncbi:uncharacterized [Tachysurus ichikawai]
MQESGTKTTPRSWKSETRQRGREASRARSNEENEGDGLSAQKRSRVKAASCLLTPASNTKPLHELIPAPSQGTRSNQ